MQLTNPALAALTNHPHRSRLFCSIWRPRTLLAATLNVGAPTRGLEAIPYSGGTETGYADIQPGHILWVGTQDGKNDIGRLLIKDKSGNQAAGTITVAANSLVWRPTYKITVKEKRELVTRPAKTVDGVLYKDSNLAYNGQNSLDWPVCIIGPHRVGFLDNAGSITFNFDASLSYPEITEFQWVTSGGTLTNPTGATTSLIITESDLNSTNKGQFYIGCTVTNESGTHTGYRSVFVHIDDVGSEYYPYRRWSLNSFPQANYEQGSWLTRLYVHGTADYDTFEDVAQIILWHAPKYGSSGHAPIGVPGAENQFFSGYTLRGTVVTDWEKSTVIFEAGSITEVMKRVRAMPFSLVAEPVAQTWYQYTHPMNINKATKHAVKWGSNLLDLCDVFLPVNNTTPFKTHDFQEGSLYQQTQGLLDRISGRIAANIAGQVWMQTKGQYLPDAQRAALPVAATLNKSYQREEVVLVDRGAKSTGAVRVSGATAEVGTGEQLGKIIEVPYCSIAPGEIPFPAGGDMTSLDNMIVSSQAEADRLSGLVLAVENRPIIEVRYKFAGNWVGAIDIAPEEIWRLSLAAADNRRGIQWTNQRLYVRSIDTDINIEAGSILLDVVFEPEVAGDTGVPFDCEKEMPQTPMPEGPGRGQTDDDDDPEEGGSGGDRALLSFSDMGSGMYMLKKGQTSWLTRNGALAGNQIENKGGIVDPYWNDNDVDESIILKTNVGNIYRSESGGESWSQLNTPTLPNYWGDVGSPTGLTFTHIIANPFHRNDFYVLAEWRTNTLWRGALLTTSSGGSGWAWHEIDGDTPSHFKPIRLALSGRGGKLWITGWRDGQLILYRLAQATFNIENTYNLGVCPTINDLDSQLYLACPESLPGNDDHIYIAGRMVNPVGLVGTFALIKSVNQGTSWSSIINNWKVNIAAACRIKTQANGVPRFYIVRRTAG